ncbi:MULTISPECIES: Blp family class II bacteriocin [Lactobacillus]|uniref:Uncharacterized protein n=1 Tax=Lactobacillus xujianguonis TaxID=2495899 RepID=A0A437STT6_9LACO|nr:MULTISPECIES: Blp family class II bacteriocin [Lactobacillus]RVU70351.1 hypothetical protein EJK17_08235 [Lactobacillus xujianguonis]RVU76895.1 hypothetical protein EJK20_03705 [Lactobacillus xujianguonis]
MEILAKSTLREVIGGVSRRNKVKHCGMDILKGAKTGATIFAPLGVGGVVGGANAGLIVGSGFCVGYLLKNR